MVTKYDLFGILSLYTYRRLHIRAQKRHHRRLCELLHPYSTSISDQLLRIQINCHKLSPTKNGTYDRAHDDLHYLPRVGFFFWQGRSELAVPRSSVISLFTLAKHSVSAFHHTGSFKELPRLLQGRR